MTIGFLVKDTDMKESKSERINQKSRYEKWSGWFWSLSDEEALSYSDMSLLQYELYIARQTINDLRSVVPDTVEADRLFSADSIDYLRSIREIKNL